MTMTDSRRSWRTKLTSYTVADLLLPPKGRVESLYWLLKFLPGVLYGNPSL